MILVEIIIDLFKIGLFLRRFLLLVEIIILMKLFKGKVLREYLMFLNLNLVRGIDRGRYDVGVLKLERKRC